MGFKCFSILPIFMLLVVSASAGELDDLLSKHYAARGGLERIKSVRSLKMTGTIAMQGMQLPTTIIIKRPDKKRIEFEVQGMTGIQATDGESAWQVNPLAGQPDPEPMPDQDATAFKAQADIDGPLVDWKAKGHTVELLGTENVDGVNCYKLKLVTKSGNELFIYIGDRQYLQVRLDATRMIQGSEVPIETTYADYERVDGMMMAHTIKAIVKATGFEQTVKIDKIEPNVDVDDSMFAMPRKGQ